MQSQQGTRPESWRHGERGETLIEFAFASVVFFLLIFGIIQFGIAVFTFNMVSNLAQEGARYAAVHGKNSGAAQDESQVVSFVTGRAVGLNVTATTNPSTTGPSLVTAGNTVAVTVTKPLNWGGGLLPLWSFNVSSTATMIVTR